MATAESVLKPDFKAQRKHFIFTDEHEQLRESIRNFAIKELAPHAEEWEETTFPDSVFQRMGELGFLGLDKPEQYGGQGGDYFTSLVLAEEIGNANSGGLAMGIAVHTDMAMPPILAFGTEEQKQEWVVPAIKGEKILCLGITEPDAGSDVAGIKTRAVQGRRRLRHQRLEDLHHQRPPRRRDRARDEDRPGRRLRRLHAVPRADGRPGVIREKKLEKLGMHASDTALLAFQDVRVPDVGGARPGRQGLLPHHVGAPGRAPDRRRRLRRGRAEMLRPHAAVRQRAQSVRHADRPLPGDPPQVRRDGDEDRVGAPDGVRDRVALRQRRVPGAGDLDGQAARLAHRRAKSPTSASRSTAARAT